MTLPSVTLCHFWIHPNALQAAPQQVTLHWGHMSITASQITSHSTVCSTAHSSWQQRKHQSSALLAVCKGNPPVSRRFPSQRASNVKSISISCPHHASGLTSAGKVEPLHWANSEYNTSKDLCSLVILFCAFLRFNTSQFYPYPSTSSHWHWRYHMIDPLPVQQP